MGATLRLILIQVRAYRRRRGWHAWHVAVLVRGATIPSLAELTGEIGHETVSDDQLAHKLRLWGAAIDRMEG